MTQRFASCSSEASEGDSDASDRCLLEQYRLGDQDAAAVLYSRYAERIFGLVRVRIASHLSARFEPDDIVQSVFKSLFRGVQSGSYDAPEGQTLWQLLAVIAVNKVRKRARGQVAQRRDARRTVSWNEVPGGDLSDQREAVRELELSVREVMETLRPADRGILLLRMHQYSVQEISEQTGRSRRTVERVLQRCRQALGEALDMPELSGPTPANGEGESTKTSWADQPSVAESSLGRDSTG